MLNTEQIKMPHQNSRKKTDSFQPVVALFHYCQWCCWWRRAVSRCLQLHPLTRSARRKSNRKRCIYQRQIDRGDLGFLRTNPAPGRRVLGGSKSRFTVLFLNQGTLVGRNGWPKRMNGQRGCTEANLHLNHVRMVVATKKGVELKYCHMENAKNIGCAQLALCFSLKCLNHCFEREQKKCHPHSAT